MSDKDQTPVSTRKPREYYSPPTSSPHKLPLYKSYTPAIERFILDNVVSDHQTIPAALVNNGSYNDAHARFSSECSNSYAHGCVVQSNRLEPRRKQNDNQQQEERYGYQYKYDRHRQPRIEMIASHSQQEVQDFLASKTSLSKYRMRQNAIMVGNSTEGLDCTVLESQNDLHSLIRQDLTLRREELNQRQVEFAELKRQNKLIMIRTLVEKGVSQEEIEAFVEEE